MRARLHGTRRRVYVFLGVLALAGVIEAGVVLAGVGTQRASTTSRAHTPATAAAPASSSHALTASSASSSASASSSHVTVGHSVKNDTSRPLRSIRPIAIRPTPDHEANPNPQVPIKGIARPEAVRQTRHFPNAMPGTGLNFDGIPFPGVTCNCAPPDTNGEVGATQYVQIVNEGYQVFNKTTGASVLGPVAITTLWSGFGGVCQTERRRRPGRALRPARQPLGHHASSPARARRPTSASPSRRRATRPARTTATTSTSARTSSTIRSSAVWPDAYYMSDERLQLSGHRLSRPAAVRVRPRRRCSPGQPATFVTTGPTSSSVGYHPAGRPRRLDAAAGRRAESVARRPTARGRGRCIASTSTSRRPRTRPSRSSPTLSPAAFTQLCTGNAQLRAAARLGRRRSTRIGDRSMFRLAYRNFGDGHEALVGNHTVSSGGVAGIRWFELRNVTAGPPTFVQESTYQPDTTWRWMGSAAMDAQRQPRARLQRLERHDQSRRSATPDVSPAIPSNTLAQGEATLFAGHRQPDGHRQPLGRLQRHDRRPGRRLHVLVHERVLRDDQLVQLAHAHRQLRLHAVHRRPAAATSATTSRRRHLRRRTTRSRIRPGCRSSRARPTPETTPTTG